MRVLIDTSSYLMNNNGDKAMLQVAVGRLAKLDPKLEATVLTTNPSQVRAVCPEATPFPMNEGYRWYLFANVHRLRIESFSRHWWAWEKRLRRRFPSLVLIWLRYRWREQVFRLPDLRAFLEAVQRADLVMSMGGGYFSDSFATHARDILDTLEEGNPIGQADGDHGLRLRAGAEQGTADKGESSAAQG